ncbi:hypothetical protein PR001_g16820 [Phytophthora rubi]|uniref:Reverse transcriptase Ty1/copia-type domain-containing protein n=1 Tax=Phytophthora rubi TaxID=129364 RepID=A0A6A3KS27_9STRA|nr:hypothetical protein PR001_g16820 [Phytophthora rubi]
MLGYSSSTKGYKLLDLRTGSVLLRRSGNVFCHECFTVAQAYVRQLLMNTYKHGAYELPEEIPIVPIATSFEERLFPEAGSPLILPHVQQSGLTSNEPELIEAQEQVGVLGQDIPAEMPATASIGETTKAVERSTTVISSRKRKVDHDDPDDDYEPPRKMPEVAQKQDARARRARKAPAHLREYVVGSVMDSTEDIPIPNTYKQMKKSKQWPERKAAMEEELSSLHHHGIWKLVARAKARHQAVITNKWVYTIKRDAQDRITRFKARLVVHGFKQRLGVDFAETYAPVIRFETIRAAILYALKLGWNIRQYDVKTAFLYGLLKEVIFMEARMMEHLVETCIGFTRLDSDYGLYAMFKDGSVSMLLTVYVDDLLLMSPPDLCDQVA